MNITITIPDNVLRAAVEAQVGEALATLTHDAIKAKADTIITTVFARFDAYAEARRAAENAIRPHVEKAINEALGNGYQRREAVHSIVREAAKAAIKEGLK